jgi:hypothetical protein
VVIPYDSLPPSTNFSPFVEVFASHSHIPADFFYGILESLWSYRNQMFTPPETFISYLTDALAAEADFDLT